MAVMRFNSAQIASISCWGTKNLVLSVAAFDLCNPPESHPTVFRHVGYAVALEVFPEVNELDTGAEHRSGSGTGLPAMAGFAESPAAHQRSAAPATPASEDLIAVRFCLWNGAAHYLDGFLKQTLVFCKERRRACAGAGPSDEEVMTSKAYPD
jgi:hypothetical protein